MIRNGCFTVASSALPLPEGGKAVIPGPAAVSRKLPSLSVSAFCAISDSFFSINVSIPSIRSPRSVLARPGKNFLQVLDFRVDLGGIQLVLADHVAHRP